MIERLKERLKTALSPYCHGAFLYGSQLKRPSMDRDVDVALLCEDRQKDDLRKALAVVQQECSYLIHAIFVSQQNVEANPHLRKLLEEARRLW
jgi:hypothetical protein